MRYDMMNNWERGGSRSGRMRTITSIGIVGRIGGEVGLLLSAGKWAEKRREEKSRHHEEAI
jgi:hypothetical protein